MFMPSDPRLTHAVSGFLLRGLCSRLKFKSMVVKPCIILYKGKEEIHAKLAYSKQSIKRVFILVLLVH